MFVCLYGWCQRVLTSISTNTEKCLCVCRRGFTMLRGGQRRRVPLSHRKMSPADNWNKYANEYWQLAYGFFCHLAVLRPCRDKGLFFYLTRHNNEHTTKELSGIFGYFIWFNFRNWCDSGKGKTRAERKSIMFHRETCNQTNFCQIRRKQAHKVLVQKWMKRKTLCLCVFSLYFPVHRLSSLLQQLINLKLFSACFFFPLSLLSYFCYRRHSEIFAVTIILLNLFCCPFSCWK